MIAVLVTTMMMKRMVNNDDGDNIVKVDLDLYESYTFAKIAKCIY